MSGRQKLLASIVVVLLTAAGCGNSASSDVDVTGIWWAEQLDGEEIEVGVNTAEIPWFEITDETIGGSFGCNGGGGEYSLDANVLIASDLASQAVLCAIPDGSEVMVPTELILQELLTVPGGFEVSIDGDTMVWTGAGHEVSFQAASGEPPPPTTVPPQNFDRLLCAPGVVVESRHGYDGSTPFELAKEAEPTAVRVERGGPLQWWGYDSKDDVVVGVFLGDVPDPDYQIVVCEQ